jgi:hypothetical protein
MKKPTALNGYLLKDFIALFIVLFASAGNLQATNLIVSSTGDSGMGTLRAAVASAVNGDTVSFAPGTNGTPIVLTTGQISINAGITILGNGAANTIIDGNQASCAFYIPYQVPNDTIRIQNLKIQNGYNTTGAGGIAVYAITTDEGFVLNLSYVEITACISNCGCSGSGGAMSMRSGNIDHCYFHHNREISGNNGVGGVDAFWSPVNITNTTIAYCAGTFAGALSVNGLGSLSNCTIYADTALNASQGIGGLSVSGPMINCTVSGCYGAQAGGVAHGGYAGCSIINSIIYGNNSGDTTAKDVRIVIDNMFGNGLDNATYKKSIVGVCKYESQTAGSCPAWFSTADPLLGTFGMNGGATPTIPILGGSAARDAADTSFAPIKDQRDSLRFGTADIGAYEFQCGAVTVTIDAFSPDTLCLNASPVSLPLATPFPGVFSGAGVSNNIYFNPTTAGVGTHTITYTHTDQGCIYADSTTVTVELCSGIADLQHASGIQVFPNPFKSMVYVERSDMNTGSPLLQLEDINGRLISSVVANEQKQSIDLSALPSGIYVLKVKDNLKTYSTKLVKE